MLAKIRDFVKTYQNDIILVTGVVLISLLSFAAGFLAATWQVKEPLLIEQGDASHFSQEATEGD